jgi:DtxR family Mn-dependent transcriptional regulator
MLTRSEQDYLKAILARTAHQDRAATGELAAHMGVSPASITHMLKKLASHHPPLVDYRRHRGAALTGEGRQQALAIIRRHRLVETFLHQALGYTWDEVHDEADRLEHVISGDFEDRIAQALGDPTSDPHGEPIPTSDARLPHVPGRPLGEMRPGQIGVVRQVSHSPPPLLRHLASLGLVPEARVRAVAYSPLDQVLSLDVEGRTGPVVIGPAISQSILVEME